jgi:hypothetical protein
MAYNPFPIGYQPYYQANYQPLQNQPQNQNTGIIWVSGEVGARGYPVAPNTTIQLWDSDENVIYIKSADASGMPSMKILDYTIRDNPSHGNALQKQPQIDLSGYVTKEEFEKRMSEVIRQKVTGDE